MEKNSVNFLHVLLGKVLGGKYTKKWNDTIHVISVLKDVAFMVDKHMTPNTLNSPRYCRNNSNNSFEIGEKTNKMISLFQVYYNFQDREVKCNITQSCCSFTTLLQYNRRHLERAPGCLGLKFIFLNYHSKTIPGKYALRKLKWWDFKENSKWSNCSLTESILFYHSFIYIWKSELNVKRIFLNDMS